MFLGTIINVGGGGGGGFSPIFAGRVAIFMGVMLRVPGRSMVRCFNYQFTPLYNYYLSCLP